MVQYEDGLEYPNEQFILADGEQINSQYNESDCFFSYNMTLDNDTSIKIISAFIPEWEIEVITVDFEPYCLDIFESLKQVKEFKICDYSHFPQFNNRVEQTCIYPESVSKLTEYGYLI